MSCTQDDIYNIIIIMDMFGPLVVTAMNYTYRKGYQKEIRLFMRKLKLFLSSIMTLLLAFLFSWSKVATYILTYHEFVIFTRSRLLSTLT